MSILLEYREPPPPEELTSHPVLELMRARHESGSLPGSRDDGAVLAVAIEGGGMRGMVSAGMAAAVEELGLTHTVDRVYGSSAGSLNGSFLVAGQALWGCSIYYNDLRTKKFVDMRRMAIGRAAVNMDYVVHDVYVHQRPLDYQSILRSEIPLHCLATNVKTAQIDDLTDFADVAELQQALLASTRIPGLAGRPVAFRGERYLDATLAESIPVSTAQAQGATHILVLQTRPYGQHLTGARFSDKVIGRYLHHIEPGLAALHAGRPQRYADALNFIDAKAIDGSSDPAVCPVRPAPGTPVVGQLEQSRSKLVAGAMSGMRAFYEVWTGQQHVIKELMKAIPAAVLERWNVGAR